VYAGVDPKNTAKSVDLILKEMRRLKETGLEETELRNAKEFTKGSLLLSSESVDNQMVRLAQNEIYFGHFIPLQYIVEKIEAVTAGEIHSLVQQLFKSEPLTLNVLGPITDGTSFDDALFL
jgi:predicted Zn-dependent peptidase